MNNYIKNILYLTIGAIALLVCLLVFWKHAKFAQCYVVSLNEQKVIIIDNDSYKAMQDKKNLLITINDNDNKFSVFEWTQNTENKMWSTIIDDIIPVGSYQVFLKYSNLLW